jgi:hypothetical protein
VLTLDPSDVVLTLQIDPKLRAIAEVTAKPYRSISSDRAPSIEDIRYPPGGYPDIERKPIAAETSGGQLAPE